jgi:aminoglycoside phosphotransferase family enzyme
MLYNQSHYQSHYQRKVMDQGTVISTPTNAKIKSYGQPKFMKKKIDENFETLVKLNTNNKIVHSKFHRKLISFITKNKPLFYKRIREDKIHEIHGDLYLRNIFIVNSNVGIE